MTTILRKGRHSVTSLYSHLVFVTKYRRKVFTSENIEDLKKTFETVAESMDFKVLEVNGEADHVHLMIEYPPKLSISKIVNHLKGVSSRMIKPRLERLPHSEHLWSPSYFASSCGGITIEKLKDYINNQQESIPPYTSLKGGAFNPKI